jgi:hypothetical protein
MKEVEVRGTCGSRGGRREVIQGLGCETRREEITGKI